MLKKAPIYFLLVLFLYNQVGYFVAFKTKQYFIRKEVKSLVLSELPKEKLEKITFQLNSDNYKKLYWENSHEFKWKGNLYDVIKQEQRDEYITFYCLQDKNEDAILSQLDNHIQKHIKSDTKKEKHQKNQISKSVKDYFYTTLNFQLYKTTSILYYFENSFKLQELPVDIFIPPPIMS